MGMRSWLHSPKGRRVLATSVAGLAGLMAIAAISVAAYPYYTDVKAGRQQETLRQVFKTDKFAEDFQMGRLVDGSPLTRIKIPSIGADRIVVEGTSLAALNTGAGHYPGSPMPGQVGNMAIAGHRTMYGGVFRRLADVKPGDKVYLETPFAKYTYEITMNAQVTDNNNWDIIDEKFSTPMLTLTTCHPPGKAAQRLYTRAKLIDSQTLTGA
ncbi:MAG: class E sortase [Actinomycetota bacterium]